MVIFRKFKSALLVLFLVLALFNPGVIKAEGTQIDQQLLATLDVPTFTNGQLIALEIHEDGSKEVYTVDENAVSTLESVSARSNAISPQNVVSRVLFRPEWSPDVGNSKVYASATVVGIEGNIPISISATFYLNRMGAGGMGPGIVLQTEVAPIGIYVGASATRTLNITSTNFYQMSFYMTVSYPGQITPVSAASNSVLLNRMARPWPGPYTDYTSGKTVDYPALNMVKTSNPVSWGTSERTTFRNWYMSTYNVPNYDWTNIEIHHIVPREYGGTNANSNLIPLPKNVHTLYTSWFAGY